MQINSPVARALVALAVLVGITGTAAQTASAKAPAAKTVKKAKAVKVKKAPAQADLLAHSLHVDFSDDGFDIRASVTNTGTRAAKASYVTIVLSADTALSTDDIVLQNYQLPAIAAGVQRTFDTDVPLPDDMGDGTQYVLVCADGTKNVPEMNEKNNCASQLINSADVTSSDDSANDGF